MRTHASPLGRHNPTYCGHRRQITNGRRTISQLQIAECSNGRACCLFNLLNLVGGDQHHHDLDVALVKGGTHPCLHKLATTRPTPHPKVISLIDGKLKDVGRSMTREQLVDGRERYLKKKEV